MAEVSTKERIKEIEKFLSDEEENITKAPFKGEYKTPILGFTGKFKGDVDLPVEEPALATLPAPTPPTPTPLEPPPVPIDLSGVITLLRRILINQLIERRSWERNNPLLSDSPVYDWAEETIDPGYIVTFNLPILEGNIFFFDYFNITYNANTIYNLYIDGVGPGTLPTLTDVILDFGNHQKIFLPPRLCYQNVIITALNNDDVAHTYSVFIRGFFRSSTKIDKEYLGAR